MRSLEKIMKSVFSFLFFCFFFLSLHCSSQACSSSLLGFDVFCVKGSWQEFRLVSVAVVDDDELWSCFLTWLISLYKDKINGDFVFLDVLMLLLNYCMLWKSHQSLLLSTSEFVTNRQKSSWTGGVSSTPRLERKTSAGRTWREASTRWR